ncbi:hypothetical protein [Methylomonas fluvii]|uniref:Uncharacterized protein n=1 Tax=Methylomonas fluvii TaxID=1854564 RepID=A0ABR9DJZ0_9GAMM|nr:hypothetical protein [Methylomonas fluvii]MBD9363417.1 hypothetical protein [Methylomonas fluvii]CAD6876700.1 hypothetical protein [Methylomonas fluvii]
MNHSHRAHGPKKQLETLFDELLHHDGFGELRVEMRLLKRGQKEVILHCGKQYRYVVDFQSRYRPPTEAAAPPREQAGPDQAS